MKNQLLVPPEKQKQHHLDLNKVSRTQENKWNIFSSRPKAGEKWLTYPFDFSGNKDLNIINAG